MIIKVSKKLGIKLVLILLLFALTVFLSYNFLKDKLETNLNTENFYKGIIIEGVNVEGKSRNEATSLIYDKLKKAQENITITVFCDEKSTSISGTNFIYKYNVEKTVNEAYNYARNDANLFSRYFELLKVQNDENKFIVEATLDEENLTRNVNSLMNEFDDKDLEAHVKEFNPDNENMFVYANGKDGYKLDRAEVTQQVKDFVLKRKSGDIYLQKHEYRNTTTITDAKNRTRLIGEFKTMSTNSENGNQNMKLSMKAVNGTTLNPGETFSFNAIVGDSNDPSRGFLPGSAILNGEIVMAYGGGVCQAATTIYGAAIRADMTIIERRNHRFKSSYVPYGLDAAIDYNNIDLKFRNDLFYPVYIRSIMTNDNELICQIFGPKSEKFDKIEVNSWITDETNGIKTEAERVYYKNNKIINKKKLPPSIYKAK
ncbi:vanW-like protein [Clostridium sp. CAG:557]|nr:vanW-like protein [Clostridium sp. CAG:557]